MRTSKPETLIQALPGFVQSFFPILLMWLIAQLIFLPLSAESFTKDLAGRVTPIVAAAFVVGIGCLLPQAARDGRATVRLLSSVVAKARYAKRRQARMQRVLENLGQALLFGVLGIAVSSLLYWVHPLFGGMALLAAIVLVSIFALQGASHASEEILEWLTGRETSK